MARTFRRRPLIRKKRIIPRYRSPLRGKTIRSFVSSRAAAERRAIERRLWRDNDMMGIIITVMLIASLLVGAVEFAVAMGVVLAGYMALNRRSTPATEAEPDMPLTDDEKVLAEWEALTKKQDGYTQDMWQKAMKNHKNK